METNKEAGEQVLIPGRFEGFLCNKLFDARLIRRKNMLFDENIHFCEDLLFVCKFLLDCKNISYTTNHYYHYIKNSNSATENINKKYLSRIVAIDYIVEELKGTELENLAKAAAANTSSIILIDVYATPYFTSNIKQKMICLKNKYRREFWQYPFGLKYRVKFIGMEISVHLFINLYRYVKKIKNILVG